MEQPEIKYPINWEYRVIGEDGDAVKIAVKEIMGDTKFTINSSKKSSKGKYLSFVFKCKVVSEVERQTIFNLLKASPAVKMVL